MNALKRIAKYLHAAVILRNTTGVTLELGTDLTTTTDALELIAGKASSSTGARLKLFKPATNTDPLARLLLGATVVGEWTNTGYTINGGAISGAGLTITGSSSPKTSVQATGGATLEAQADGGAGYLGTVTDHPTIIRSNSVDIIRAADNECSVGLNVKTVNFFERTAQGLSPAPSASYPQFFVTPNTVMLEAPGDYNSYHIYNAYFDGTDFRALSAGEASELVAGATGYRFLTAPSASAGGVVTFTSRDGQPTAGRQWSNLTGSRALDTIYQNVTGYEIQLGITISHDADSSVDIKVDTATPPTGIVGRSAPLVSGSILQLYATVPNLAYYELDTIVAGASLVQWLEMR